MREDVFIRQITSMQDLNIIEKYQKIIWGFSEDQIVHSRLLFDMQREGGLVLGAFDRKTEILMGFLFSFIGMEDGIIVPLGQTRSRKKAYDMMAEMVEKAVGKDRKIDVAFVHVAAFEEAKKLKAIIEARLECVETVIAELSPALGVHTGPGTAGICFYPVLGRDKLMKNDFKR